MGSGLNIEMKMRSWPFAFGPMPGSYLYLISIWFSAHSNFSTFSLPVPGGYQPTDVQKGEKDERMWDMCFRLKGRPKSKQGGRVQLSTCIALGAGSVILYENVQVCSSHLSA